MTHQSSPVKVIRGTVSHCCTTVLLSRKSKPTPFGVHQALGNAETKEHGQQVLRGEATMPKRKGTGAATEGQ